MVSKISGVVRDFGSYAREFHSKFFCKGYDPDSCFSGINIFSGLSLWKLQLKKRSLMECLFFDAGFSKKFHFGRQNQLICNILASNPKSELGDTFRIISFKL